ncbi:hypothetical protein D8674_014578 [Pyrus ussuriensis x Pyrus communis]|uniref:Uncharacterized protein n=1 Tax=Pyrus ussuriensis x Pyrus communis TaxID=2448454 RepID=A0A5N5GT10_9ROSA|nr:hypothetical protein D8674_014578 [Pyrus ussuriensis x Pyrus communis]
MLPEVLRHSLPSKIFYQSSETTSSLDTASQWVFESDSKNGHFVSAEALNPLRAYLSLPPSLLAAKEGREAWVGRRDGIFGVLGKGKGLGFGDGE